VESYENPDLPDGVNVNVSGGSALGEFLRLAAALAVFCVAVVAAVIFGARWLAPHIPFRHEVAFAAPIVEKFDDGKNTPQRQYLQQLADALAAHMALPDGMTLTLHVSDSREPNAFATLGGHIIVTQGLLDLVGDENALAMVVAHEIAHIKHRDPIVAAGSGVAVAIVMGVLFGNSDLAGAGSAPGLLTQLTFSRAQESAADHAALDALTARYGHTNGAETFFAQMLDRHPEGAAVPEFLSTHPDLARRLTRIQTNPAHRPDAALTPLPEAVRKKAR
jgi:Zn-dependent protease with chaperone function